MFQKDRPFGHSRIDRGRCVGLTLVRCAVFLTEKGLCAVRTPCSTASQAQQIGRMRSGFRLPPGPRRRRGKGAGWSPVPGSTGWRFMISEPEESGKSSKSGESERAGRRVPSRTARLLGGCGGRADRKGSSTEDAPASQGEALVCSHRRNANGLETGLPAIVFVRTQDRLAEPSWVSSSLFFPPRTRLLVFTGHLRPPGSQTVCKHTSQTPRPVGGVSAWPGPRGVQSSALS